MEDIRKGVCPVCSHNEIVEAVPEPDRVDGFSARPLAITYAGRSWKLPSILRVFGLGHWGTPVGQLMTYFCRRCGFTQWYANAPETVPLDAPGMRLIKGAEVGSAYR